MQARMEEENAKIPKKFVLLLLTGSRYKTTEHWKTNYEQKNTEVKEIPKNQSFKPEWSTRRRAYSSSRGYWHTEYAQSLGTYGHDPRNKLNSNTEAIKNEEHDLT